MQQSTELSIICVAALAILYVGENGCIVCCKNRKERRKVSV